MSELVEVDGSYGEGGGQIIRNGVTLSCLLSKNLRVKNIRANRPKPGLASQHLESILALLKLSGATTTTPLQKGQTEFELIATLNKIENGDIETTIDLITAGSITLCIQCILPYIIYMGNRAKVRIIGGTHVLKAPNTDYMDRVFIPNMSQFGYDFNIVTHRKGYFPRGGGQVDLNVKNGSSSYSLKNFHSFKLVSRGELKSQHVILNLNPKLYAEKNRFTKIMKSVIGRLEEGSSLIVNKVNYVSVEYFLRFENSNAGFYELVEGRNVQSEDVFKAIEKVEGDLNRFLKTKNACVDEFMQDQLIIYMTLSKLSGAKEESEYTTIGPLTDHSLSAIHVSELFTKLKFKIENIINQDEKTHTVKVSI